jgi:hypothetical protein
MPPHVAAELLQQCPSICIACDEHELARSSASPITGLSASAEIAFFPAANRRSPLARPVYGEPHFSKQIQ